MTRKEKIDKLIKEAGDNFRWSYSKYMYWNTAVNIINDGNLKYYDIRGYTC